VPDGLTKDEERAAWEEWVEREVRKGGSRSKEAEADVRRRVGENISDETWKFVLSVVAGFKIFHLSSLAHHPHLYAYVQHAERVEFVVLHHPPSPSPSALKHTNTPSVPSSSFTFTLPSSPSPQPFFLPIFNPPSD